MSSWKSQLDSTNVLPVRTAAILTNAYVAGTVLDTYLQNQLVLLINFTKGSLTSAEIKLEFSYDGTNYFQETSRSISAGTSTESPLVHSYAASNAYVLDIPIMYHYVKVSAIGTGTVTGSSLTIGALVGTV